MEQTKDKSRVFTRREVDTLLSAAIGQTLEEVDKAGMFKLHARSATTYTQHKVQGTLPQCTNRNRYFSCGQSFVFLIHKQSNVLRSRNLHRAKGCTPVPCLGLFSELQASALLSSICFLP